MSNPVLGQETVASLRRKSEQARKANEAARLRTGRATPKELKALAAEAKAAEKALKKAENEARQANNRETNDAISRLNNAKKGSYGSMDGSTSDRRSGTKQLTAEAKAAEKALKKAERKALQKKNIERDEATSRLDKNDYGSMDGSTSDRRSGTKQLTAAQLKAKAAQKREQDLKKSKSLQDAADYRKRRKTEDQLAALLARKGVTAMPPKNSAKSTTTGNLENVNVPVKPKTFGETFAAARKEKGAGKTFMYKGKKYTTDRADDKPKVTKEKNFGSMDGSTSDPKTMTNLKPAKKKRDRLFGLDFLPEIDSKEGGDKFNLPFGLGSFETLPQEEETSMNKKGGRIKYKSGGKIRKAGCKRGMGKALRGY